MLRFSLPLALVLTLLALVPAPPAGAASGNVAALQLALRVRALYGGPIDGIPGPGTRTAVRRFQARAGLGVDGVAGPRTRRALGRHGRPRLGSRAITSGDRGWDVAAVQFMLGRHGFPSGSVDGGMGPRSQAAVRRFQQFRGLHADGVVGPATLRALRGGVRRASIRLSPPVGGPRGDSYGPRGDRFHSGVDYPVPAGTTVRAAASGRVVFAGWDTGGYGNTVIVSHGGGRQTLYAHLSGFRVSRGAWVGRGAPIGAVGSTGNSTGPHLHLELRLHGATLNPRVYGA
jgi:murein DD-endopeptidase MepM/ murein hydrolase activator NlpD